jgi:hypothetical protein
MRTRFLQALFPSALFVVIVRHPVPVAYSQRRPGKVTLETLFRHWVHVHKLFRGDEPHLRNVLVVKYEDFTRAPQAALDSVYSRLGLPSHPLGLEVRDENSKYFRLWRMRLDPVTITYKWWLARRYEEGVAPFGYSLSELGRVGPWPSPAP